MFVDGKATCLSTQETVGSVAQQFQPVAHLCFYKLEPERERVMKEFCGLILTAPELFPWQRACCGWHGVEVSKNSQGRGWELAPSLPPLSLPHSLAGLVFCRQLWREDGDYSAFHQEPSALPHFASWRQLNRCLMEVKPLSHQGPADNSHNGLLF